ncbi:DUF2294 domain-containing protein [Paraconexibacter antarcticus]|uniref:DUF2294 domain-containing protein n=1 Tax=Paraconexibacter antarcticus TaxID=2949664 RepID=A0ABY5DRA1_9ACTN|nr:Na-translocating system protein MpsC family protein [Paraconexibacter antarcticus]UTI63778.1 DUF2294 domain-containing protein [Paraconexibacter antarcticus]
MADDEASTARDSMTSAISNHVVQLTREYTGRGPTKARTYLNQDLVTVVMQDALTRAEHHLIDDDGEALVLRTRRAYQDTMRARLIEGIEQLTSRRVLAFLSANSIAPDYSIESFILEGAP